MTVSLARGPTHPAFDFDAYLAAEQDTFEAELARLAAELPASFPAALREPVLYALGTRGKRLRPILCAAAYRAVSHADPPDALVRLGCGLELVHTYSLVHDDLPCMDDDDLRRGRPTVHRTFGVPAALLAGAALLPLAVQVTSAAGAALGLNVAERGRLVAELCRAAGATGMVGGQLLDLLAEEEQLDGEALEQVHRAKTGALLAAALRIGALAGRADAPRLEALTAYGESLGLAFQIVDDILDVVGETSALGKRAGKDRSIGKATYPALFGLDGARELARSRAADAVAALHAGGVASEPLEALARFVVERRR